MNDFQSLSSEDIEGVNMSNIAHELIEKWVEKNAPPGLFDKEDESVGNKKLSSS